MKEEIGLIEFLGSILITLSLLSMIIILMEVNTFLSDSFSFFYYTGILLISILNAILGARLLGGNF